MYTDTSLHDGERTIVIECKWRPALQTGRGGGKTLNADHLRQVHAYISQHVRAQVHASSVEGLLLYPLADDPVDVAVRVREQWVRVRTLDLQAHWQEIRTQLLGLIEHDSGMVTPSGLTIL